MKVHVLLPTLLILCAKYLTSGLLLYELRDDESQPKITKGDPKQLKSPIRVLAFGDSWVEMGPSYWTLFDMFENHNVAAHIKYVARSGTRACQWAHDPLNLKHAVNEKFGKSGAHFIWYSLGGNDLLDPHYTDCSKVAPTLEAARNCLRSSTAIVNTCRDQLLNEMWKVWPSTKVMQCSYDFACADQNCFPLVRVPFCGLDLKCQNDMTKEWSDMLLNSSSLGSKPYTGINIMGTLQMAGGLSSSPGAPISSLGSPCNFVDTCVHPIRGLAGAAAIGQAFWDLYFSLQVGAGSAPVPATQKPPPWIPVGNIGNIEEQLTMCMWNWMPSFSHPQGLPPCKRTWEDLTHLSESEWYGLVA